MYNIICLSFLPDTSGKRVYSITKEQLKRLLKDEGSKVCDVTEEVMNQYAEAISKRVNSRSGKCLPPKGLIEGFDFGNHLRGLIGDPPKGMVDPHAHHILFKKGLGSAQQALVDEGQAILRKVGIDPIYGKENLIWAPWRVSNQHGIESLKTVVEKLRELDKLRADYDEVVEALKRLGEEAAKRGT